MGLLDWVRTRTEELLESRLGTEFRERTEALTVRQNEYGFDPFGFSRDHLKFAYVIARFFHTTYFRCMSHGLDQVPEGRVLLVANHSGQLPFDALVIVSAMMLEARRPRMVRTMVEKYIPTLPFASYLLSRWGQITGTPENCRRILGDGEPILVFPEGVRGISKPFTRRYQLQPFGLGFLRLALETDTPIVPVAVIGAEEQVPAVNVRTVAKLLGAPAFPLMPIPPFFPVLPLPVKYRLYFGEPMRFAGDSDDEDEIIEGHVRAVRNSIQSMLHAGLKERKHVFW
jgi:1-acyl-sn-glycerol-3-phosphate acyltransferase